MDDRTQELLDRIEALERRIETLEGAGPRCSFHEEEKRVVDTIVRLTTEGVVAAMDERMQRRSEEHRRGDGREHDHGPPREGRGHRSRGGERGPRDR